MSRVVFANVGYPRELAYPENRAIRLAVEAGHDVHCVSLEQDHPGFPGVTHWREPTLGHMTWRIRRLRGELTFLERPGRLLVAAALTPNSWVRAPERVENALKRRLQTRLMSRVESVTFTNPHEQALWTIPATSLRELPYPVDVDFWSIPRNRDPAFWTRRGLEVPGAVVSCVANLLARKQQQVLVEWSAQLLRENPNLVLCFAGYEYEAGIVDAITSTAREHSVGSRVHVLGALDRAEARDLLAWSDIHVVNSNNETQCMAMYEGLAAGVATMLYDYPVLTSAFPGLPVHRDASTFYTNARKLLAESGVAGRRQRDEARERLAWASMRHHDELFARHLEELLRVGNRSRMRRAVSRVKK